jgi:hypothetical protein|tara:strand:- start:89 stop:292 length:204 start_codon:yes stop_codon:yes gene_type:complete
VDTPKALFAGLALIAAAVLFNGFMQPKYQIAGGGAMAWIIDTQSGMFRLCRYAECGKWLDANMVATE